MQTIHTLQAAIDEYILAVQNFAPGQTTYTDIEIPKLKIADVLLELCELPMGPATNAFFEPVERPPTRVRELVTGFVYLMKNVRNGFIKIGWSQNPEFREKTLQSEEPEIELLWKATGTRIAEAAIQLKFHAKRKRGEWFELTEQDVEQIKSLFAGGVA